MAEVGILKSERTTQNLLGHAAASQETALCEKLLH